MNSFQSTLNQLHRIRIFGRLLLMICILAALYTLSMFLLGIADYHYALSSGKRSGFHALIIGTLLLGGLFWAFKIFRSPRSITASLADRTLKNNRQTALAASHLASQEASTPMEEFHLKRTFEEAKQDLSQIPLFSKIPTRLIYRCSLGFIVLGAIILKVKQLYPQPFHVVTQRLFHPSSDIPPYSPLVFQITPDHPTAIYQGEAMVQVKISGGEIEDDVFCLVRDPASGHVEKTNTFRELPGTYARKFENSLAPLEFAFTTGHARSSWHQLDIIFQPRISGAEITVTPPAYTGKVAQTYPLESSEIRALQGATVQLKIQSNRPLAGGDLTLTAMDLNEENPPQTIQAEVIEKNQIAFTWTALRSSQLSAIIRDIRYTEAEKPLTLTLKTIPDQVPVVTMSEPSPLVLATPRSSLPMQGDIEDDHGLSRVTLTRTLVGYRDRNQELAQELTRQEYVFEDSLKLEELGVEPGQTLEFYLEATDRNPSLLGVGVSDIVRVHIISEADYAERVRNQFQLKQFTARYRALSEALRKSKEALQELKNNNTPEQRKKALQEHQKAEQLARKIAEDFKAFEMEERLQEIAREAADLLSQNQAELQNKPTPEAIERMLERLGGLHQQAKKIEQDAEHVKKMGDILAMAAEFRRLLNAQKSIEKRLQEEAKKVAMGNAANANQLQGLARVQDVNREALLKFAADLEARAKALPPEAEDMKADIDEFLDDFERMDIPDPMRSSAEAGRRSQTTPAWSNAKLALELMEKLIENPDNQFAQACQGQKPPQFQAKQDMAKTMQQMLEALMKKAGNGDDRKQGQGQGGGQGAGSQDGHSVTGDYSGIPAYGPDRLQFSDGPAMGSSGQGLQSGKRGKGAAQHESNQIETKTHRETSRGAIAPENIPSQYRDAVKRYFSQEN